MKHFVLEVDLDVLLMRANKYRLEPSPEQVECLENVAGACRFVYNCALEQRRDWYRRKRITYLQQQAELTQCRAEFDWLRACPVHALQCALRDLEYNFQKFFVGLRGYPKPRRKKDGEGFRLPDPRYLRFKRLSRRMGAVRLGKIGWVKVRGWFPLGGEIKNVHVRRRGKHWYVSIQWQKEVPDLEPRNLPCIGIDHGIKVFAAMSDGTKIAPLNAFKRIKDNLAKEQRRLARKKLYSSNWNKQLLKVSRLRQNAANARKDFLHKLSTEIAKSHGIVKVEKLNIKGMTASAKGTVEDPGRNVRQKSSLNRAILDQGWGMFRRMLEYKLAERGGQLIMVEAAYTSQTCAECGTVDRESRVDQATFACRHCGHTDNADVNAARNILQARTLAVEPPKRILRRVGKRKHREEAAYA